jgi:hypothetical protein
MNSAHVRVSFRVLGSAVLAASILCITGAPQAMAQQGASAVTAPAKSAPAKRQPVYIDPAHFDPVQLVAPPPADGTPRAKAELAELHAIQKQRAPVELARALADDKDESIFIYASVLGPRFKAEVLPVTDAMGKAIRNDAEIIANMGKDRFLRLRPYALDKTIAGCPYAADKPVRTSYPSGHAMNGYAYGVVLAQLFPARAEAIMARAADYAEQRLVCGHHYRADVNASAILATVYARELLANPAFKAKLDGAAAELKAAGFDR